MREMEKVDEKGLEKRKGKMSIDSFDHGNHTAPAFPFPSRCSVNQPMPPSISTPSQSPYPPRTNRTVSSAQLASFSPRSPRPTPLRLPLTLASTISAVPPQRPLQLPNPPLQPLILPLRLLQLLPIMRPLLVPRGADHACAPGLLGGESVCCGLGGY